MVLLALFSILLWVLIMQCDRIEEGRLRNEQERFERFVKRLLEK